MGIDRRQWTARAPGPTGLRARIEQVAELVEPVELPPPVRGAGGRGADRPRAAGARGARSRARRAAARQRHPGGRAALAHEPRGVRVAARRVRGGRSRPGRLGRGRGRARGAVRRRRLSRPQTIDPLGGGRRGRRSCRSDGWHGRRSYWWSVQARAARSGGGRAAAAPRRHRRSPRYRRGRRGDRGGGDAERPNGASDVPGHAEQRNHSSQPPTSSSVGTTSA